LIYRIKKLIKKNLLITNREIAIHLKTSTKRDGNPVSIGTFDNIVESYQLFGNITNEDGKR